MKILLDRHSDVLDIFSVSMKKALLIFTLLCGLFILGVPAQAADVKIGYVNFIEAMRNHPELANKRKKFEEMFSKREGELKKNLENIKAIEKELGDEAKRLVLSESDRDKKSGELRRLKQRARLERDDLEKEQKIFNNEATIELEKSLYRAVADFAKKENYDAILDARFIMYGSDKLDVTQKVLAVLKVKN